MTEGKACTVILSSFVKNISMFGRLGSVLMSATLRNVMSGYPQALLAKRHSYTQHRA